jgi:hypothetical protein
MKKFKLILAFAAVFGFIYSCNNSAVEKMSNKMKGDQSDHVCASCAKSAEAKTTFENNSKTMQLLFESYANESVDYTKFADDVVFRGTLSGSADSLGLDEIKGIHKEFFAKYDVKHMAPFNYLQGVNAETGKADGSVRMYYEMQVTNTTNDKSVVVPIYESFDFNDEGKASFVQWYCDWTASLASIE